MSNKYEQLPEREIDLHGHTTIDAKIVLDELIKEAEYKFVRIIVGKGRNSTNGPVLPNYVKNYLTARGIRYNQSKIQYGGEGALDVFLQ